MRSWHFDARNVFGSYPTRLSRMLKEGMHVKQHKLVELSSLHKFVQNLTCLEKGVFILQIIY